MFLYARCEVVASGRNYFEEVLNDPAKFPADGDYEPLLSVPAEAYELKHGERYTYAPITNYESKTNASKWGDNVIRFAWERTAWE